MSDKDTKNAGELPPELQAEADALLLETLDDTAPPVAAEGEPGATNGVDTGEMLGGLLLVTFNNLLAPKRGDHWKLAPGEAETLGQAYGVVIDKYFPDLGTGPELTAVLVSFAILGPRVAQDVAIANEPEPEPEPEPGPADTGGDNGGA